MNCTERLRKFEEEEAMKKVAAEQAAAAAAAAAAEQQAAENAEKLDDTSQLAVDKPRMYWHCPLSLALLCYYTVCYIAY